MINRMLRSAHNLTVKLAVGLLAFCTMYLGGAALLAATVVAHLVISPILATYVPEPTDLRLFILLWLGAAALTMSGIGSALAVPVTWLLDKLDTLEERLSFA